MRKSTGQTTRDVVNHESVNGKGDKTRVTDERAYRENFDEINWGPRRVLPSRGAPPVESDHDWRMGLCI